MIGYLQPLRPSPAGRLLTRSYLCGLCHHVGATYGFRYRLLVGPDLVFYNVFLDLLSAGPAPLTRSACVLAPRVTSLPTRERTENTDLAAAFGVWMAVEKLRDDWLDERSPLKWLAWKAFGPGARRAQAQLTESGFPVAEVRAQLSAQAAIERAEHTAIDVAAGPTQRIAALTFGFAARGASDSQQRAATAVGQHIGAFLFWMDALLDFGADTRAKAYNPLAAEWSTTGELPPPALDAGLAGAGDAVEALSAALDALTVRAHAPFLHSVLVTGFGDKLRRFKAMDAAQRSKAKLPAVLPPRISVADRVRKATAQARAMASLRVRMAVSFALMFLFPNAAWAERWWPQDASAEELGLAGAPDAAMAEAVETADDPSWACDACFNNVGWCDEDACFDGCCGPVCNDSCSESCSAGAEAGVT